MNMADYSNSKNRPLSLHEMNQMKEGGGEMEAWVQKIKPKREYGLSPKCY
jgi:hypothetical protein